MGTDVVCRPTTFHATTFPSAIRGDKMILLFGTLQKVVVMSKTQPKWPGIITNQKQQQQSEITEM